MDQRPVNRGLPNHLDRGGVISNGLGNRIEQVIPVWCPTRELRVMVYVQVRAKGPILHRACSISPYIRDIEIGGTIDIATTASHEFLLYMRCMPMVSVGTIRGDAAPAVGHRGIL